MQSKYKGLAQLIVAAIGLIVLLIFWPKLTPVYGVVVMVQVIGGIIDGLPEK